MIVFTFRTNKQILKRNMFIYLGVTLFVMLFSFIYELFSHGVFSIFMAFAFVLPLALGLLPYLLFLLFNKETHPSEMTSNIWNAGVATITIASIFRGVLDIYGTTRDLHLNVLTISGIVLLSIGLLSYLIPFVIKKIKNSL